MDEVKQKAAAVLVRCRGYSKNMAENCLATLKDEEIAALAAAAVPVLDAGGRRVVEYVARADCGQYITLVLDEIADRRELENCQQRLADCERVCQERPVDQAPAMARIHALDAADHAVKNYQAACQRRRAHQPADDEDDDEPEPDDPTEIAEKVP